MASRLGPLELSKPEEACTWLVAFSALSRTSGWTDDETSKKITDNFMTLCGIDALQRTQLIIAPMKIDETNFTEIHSQLAAYLQPKTRNAFAEKTKFHQSRQHENETIADYVLRLRKEAQYCQFDLLKTFADPTEEMIRVALVAGLLDPTIKEKVLERLSTNPTMSIPQILSYILQTNVIRDFSNASATCKEEPVNFVRNPTKSDKKMPVRTNNFINNCKFCGSSHLERQCPAFGKVCTKCGKRNHFSKVCRSRHSAHFSELETIADESAMHINVINNINVKLEYIKVNEHSVPMQIDTGASTSVISSKIWEKLGRPKLSKCYRRLEAYDGHVMKTLGEAELHWEKNNKIEVDRFVVVKADKDFGLLGRDLLEFQQDHLYQANDVPNKLGSESSVNKDYLPPIKGVIARMKLKKSNDVFCKARPVPLAIEKNVNDELLRLEKMGIITPIEFSKNASPVVWIRKPDGRLRMCADFKVHVNGRIETDSYPTPNVETIFSKLKNAKHFAKVDLTSAYWQVEMDDEAKDLSVINTSRGLYRMNRLQMGMKNSSSIFQRVMETMLSGLKGLLIYQDDIAIFAETRAALEKRLNAVRVRLQEKKVTINESKSIEYCDKLTFLGFVISEEGISPDGRLVQKINAMKRPSNATELQRFLGLVNYFGRLIPNFSAKTNPLNELKTNGFQWTQSCKETFEKLKQEISNFPVVQPYDLEKEATLTADASKGALGAVLTQNGKPVIYISRVLSNAEKNYSNIEREALAVTWAVLRLKHFLIGRPFTIQSDHKPLEYIFKGNTAIPSGTSTRIAKWVIELMPYNYTIKYVQGSKIPHADALSRLHYDNENNTTFEEDNLNETINAFEFSSEILPAERVVFETSTDPFIQRIVTRIRTGNWRACTQAELPFKAKSETLTTEKGMIFSKDLLFIPPRLRQDAFDLCHRDNHSGVQSSINRLKLSTWWPGMDEDIRIMVRNCLFCSKKRPLTEKSVDQWKPATKPFQRVHMDWAYIKQAECNLLVIVDSYTGWIEAFPVKDRETLTVIKCLRAVFTRFGVPEVLISDNAPEFTSVLLNDWLVKQGIKKMESPVYFPKSNGLAERAVQTVKNSLKGWKHNTAHVDFNSFVQRVLFHHRISSVSRGLSPAELMFGRRLRTPIVSRFQQGENVWFQPYDSTVKPATYVMTKGNNSSWILDDDKLTTASDSQLAPVPTGSETETQSSSRELDAHRERNEDRQLQGEAALRRSSRLTKPPLRYGYNS